VSLLYKRPRSPYWYVTKTRESTRTANRKLAEEFARKSLTEAWRVDALGESVHTWNELSEAWLDAKSHKKALKDDERIIGDFTDWISTRELADKDLGVLTGELIRNYGAFIKARASAGTANRHLAVIRAMLNIADEWGWVAKVPKIKLYKVAKKEPRWLTPEEVSALCAHMPQWLQDMVVIGSQTGMRWSNVAGLRWDWINANGTVIHVPISDAKTDDTYTVPLSQIAKGVLSRLQDARIGSEPYVFVAEGFETPIAHYHMKYRLNQAIEASGIKRCKFHDFRHTFASWHMQRETPERIIQELGGWKSPAMLQTYAHLATKHLVHYADNLNAEGHPARAG